MIAVFAFEGASPYLLCTPIRVFREAASISTDPCIEVQIFTTTAGRLRLEALDKLELEVRRGLDALDYADIVVIPSWCGADAAPPDSLITAIRRAHARGARIVGLSLGVFVLAHTGLLDGKAATTIWEFAPTFSHRFPAVRLNPNALYVCEGSIMTSAGRAAAMDCCLALVEELCGIKIADQVADNLVSAPVRHGKHAQVIRQRSKIPEQDKRLFQLMDWMKGHLHESQLINSLAARVDMSGRTLTRHFERITGESPKQWLVRERLTYARALLQKSELTIEAIATVTGIGTATALRKQFRSAFGVSPSDYRRAPAVESSTSTPD